MRWRRRSIEDLARSLRTLEQRMDLSEGNPWKPMEWPPRRQALLRRYDAQLLEAAEMLEVALPRRDEWTRPGFRGGLFGDHTRYFIGCALEESGFLRPAPDPAVEP